MKKTRGFTIIELMITLSVMAVLAAIAIPSFERLILTNAADKYRDDLYSSLVLARSEALARGTSVTLCTSTNISTTMTCSGDSADWQSGWLMFEDRDNDSTLDAGEEVLSVYQNLAQRSAVLTFNNGDNITFNRLGGAKDKGTFRLCRNDVGYETAIILQASGRARFSDVDKDGNDLGC